MKWEEYLKWVYSYPTERTIYEIRILPVMAEHDYYTFDNTSLVCRTSYKLWAYVRQIIACWRMKPDHTCMIIVCRPSLKIGGMDFKYKETLE